MTKFFDAGVTHPHTSITGLHTRALYPENFPELKRKWHAEDEGTEE